MTAGAQTVTVMVIHPNFKTVTVTVILEKLILKNNKTAGSNFDSNGKDFHLQPGREWKFLLRRTWPGQKLLPLQFPELSLP